MQTLSDTDPELPFRPEAIGVHHRAVVATARRAIDQQPTDTVRAPVAERYRLAAVGLAAPLGRWIVVGREGASENFRSDLAACQRPKNLAWRWNRQMCALLSPRTAKPKLPSQRFPSGCLVDRAVSQGFPLGALPGTGPASPRAPVAAFQWNNSLD